MMARLHHPHCVQFLGYVACPTMISGEHQIGIVMEMFERGSLDDYVNIKSDRCAKKLPFRIKEKKTMEDIGVRAYITTIPSQANILYTAALNEFNHSLQRFPSVQTLP